MAARKTPPPRKTAPKKPGRPRAPKPVSSSRFALRGVPGVDLAVRKIFGALSDRSLRLVFLSSSVRVSRRQFPDVYDRFREASRLLDIRPMPELFIAQTPFVNAGAIGVEKRSEERRVGKECRL